MTRRVTLGVGDGWSVYTTPDAAWIKFNHKPDRATLLRLRNIAAWDSVEHAWRAHPDTVLDLLTIGDQAQTWESVGEDSPSWLDDADYSIFHD